MGCAHKQFKASVSVSRFAEGEEQPSGYMADIRVACADCGRKFQFIGLPAGIDLGGAAVSVDALEAHLAICPQGEQPSALDRIAAHFRPDVVQ